MEPTEPGRAQAIRRESELEALERFFGPAFRSRGLVLCGDAGMGKTSMWEMGRSIGAANGYAVLSARASEAETGLSFAALADLVDGIPPKVLAGQPGPQRQALEVAVRRAAPAGPAPEPLAISTGFYRALLGLAQHGPLVVAIDDVQWLDEASARAIVFAAQRLQGPGVRFLLSTRSHRPSEIEKALPPESVGRLELKPLSFGAISSPPPLAHLKETLDGTGVPSVTFLCRPVQLIVTGSGQKLQVPVIYGQVNQT